MNIVRPGRRAALRTAARASSGKSPGKTAVSFTPSNTWRPMRSPGIGTPTMTGSSSCLGDVGLAGGPQCGHRHHSDSRPGTMARINRAIGNKAERGFEAIMAGVVQMVGLRGGK